MEMSVVVGVFSMCRVFRFYMYRRAFGFMYVPNNLQLDNLTMTTSMSCFVMTYPYSIIPHIIFCSNKTDERRKKRTFSKLQHGSTLVNRFVVISGLLLWFQQEGGTCHNN